MKVKFGCDSGANCQSLREDTLDTVDDLGLEEGEWENLTDEAKQAMAVEWANDRLEIWYEEIT